MPDKPILHSHLRAYTRAECAPSTNPESSAENGGKPSLTLKATLEAIAAGHPKSDIDALLPWNFGKTAIKAEA